jgi:hypothetical protein
MADATCHVARLENSVGHQEKHAWCKTLRHSGPHNPIFSGIICSGLRCPHIMKFHIASGCGGYPLADIQCMLVQRTDFGNVPVTLLSVIHRQLIGFASSNSSRKARAPSWLMDLVLRNFRKPFE